MPLLDEGMPQSTGGVALAHARQTEGEHVDGALEKLPPCELSYPLRQVRREPAQVESPHRLGRRQIRCLLQADDPSLPPRLGLEREHFVHHRQCLVELGLGQTQGHLWCRHRQMKLPQSRLDPRAHRLRGAAHDWPPASSAS